MSRIRRRHLVSSTLFGLLAALCFALAVPVAASTIGATVGSSSQAGMESGNTTAKPVSVPASPHLAQVATDTEAGEASSSRRLRYHVPDQPIELRFSGSTQGTVRLEAGRKPRTLAPRVTATSDLRLEPLSPLEGRGRIGFAITGLTFQYRDADYTLGFALGEGRGPNGGDGLSTVVDGGYDRTIPELDWGGEPTELPPSFGEVIATGHLSASDGLREIASRLPDASPQPPQMRDEADPTRASMLVYQNPAELAALYYVPLPREPLESLADDAGIASWRATLAIPPLFGEPARDLKVRLRTDINADGPLRIELTPAEEDALPAGQSFAATFVFDTEQPEQPHRATYELAHTTESATYETTWRLQPK